MPDHGGAKREDAAGGAARRRLAERRKALGLTQEALADLMGVERTTIVRWERGASAPLPVIRPKLARALRVSADRLGELLALDAPPGQDQSGADAGTRPRQLPPVVAQFTGRAAELAALTRILDDGAAGTVVISAIGGTAGVGKTALAIQWAHQAGDRFPDGQLYVNLRGYDPDRPMPPSDALAGFLRALGVGGQDIPPEEDERAARYRSLLAGRRVLVVLDNAGSAEQVRPLLPGSPNCAVVVTSRDSLSGLVARDGAARLDLDLLPLADAIRLLRDLIGQRAEDDPGATGTLAAECCRLPLALRLAAELAAVRPDVPLADLARELADERGRLDLLDAGGDQRTAVRAVFSWSYRHLDPGAARAFRLAGLHPAADFDPHSVAALTDSDLGEARRRLDALTKAHLAQPAGTGRYAMHDLLRAYASELAVVYEGVEGRHAALTRLLDHYLGTAATAMDTLYPAERHRRPRVDSTGTPVPPLPDAASAQFWMDDQRAALTAVSQYAAVHGWPRHATRLSATLRNYFVYGGYYAEAVLVHTSARRAAGEEGDRGAEGLALSALGAIDVHQGRFQQATGRFMAARDLCQKAGDRAGEARALANLGAAQYELGRYQEAIRSNQQALIVQRETGDRAGEAITLGNLGTIVTRQGHYHPAARLLRQSMELSRETGDRQQECWSMIALGDIALTQEDYGEADDLLRQGLTLARAGGYRLHEARALTRMGVLRLRQGRTEAAADRLREALAKYRKLGARDGESVVLNRLGEVHLAAGQPGDARSQHSVALSLATDNGDRLEQARAREGLGNAHHSLGDTGEASRQWREALALYSDIGVPQAARIRARLDEIHPAGMRPDKRHDATGR